MKNKKIKPNLNQSNSKTSLLFIVLLFILLFSCKSEPISELISIEVEKNVDNFQSFKLSDLSDNLEYLVLETKKESNLSWIDHIDISTNYIAIMSGNGVNCLLFDRKGKFIRQIGRRGRGPGEYAFPACVKIVNNQIFIPEYIGERILKFDINGKFLREIKSPGKFSADMLIFNWYPVTDSTFLTQIPNDTGQETARISYFNEKGDIIHDFPNTSFFEKEREFTSTIDRTGHFYSINGKIRYKEQLIDTLWEVNIEKNQLIPTYIFELGKMTFPNKYRGIIINDEKEIAVRESILIKRTFELEKYVIFESVFHKHYPFDFKMPMSAGGVDFGLQYEIIGIYNKINGELFFVSPSNEEDQPAPTGIENDIDGGVNFFPSYSSDGNLLVGWVESYELKSYVKSESFKNYEPKYPEKKKELEKLANSLDINDNPVLMLVKLKE